MKADGLNVTLSERTIREGPSLIFVNDKEVHDCRKYNIRNFRQERPSVVFVGEDLDKDLGLEGRPK
jgi:hypothetical protein